MSPMDMQYPDKRFRVYRSLDFLGKYSYKFLLIAFLGIHIPLIGIIFYVSFNQDIYIKPWKIVLVTLVFTLIATSCTLYLLHTLLSPIIHTNQQLTRYLDDSEFPSLPVHFQDEVGRLMANTQHVLNKQQQLADEKKELTELLSHDLRSPVNQVQALIQLVPGAGSAAEQQELIATIDRLCQNQLLLLNNVLKMLKQQDGQLPAEQLEEVNLREFLQECLQAQQVHLLHKNIEAELLHVQEELFIHINKVLFQQVIQNLIGNAIKFSFPGQVIHLCSKIQEDILEIHIKDQGIGFDPQYGRHLFDRFTPHGRKGTQDEPSTGLGLYLTKRIVERHTGKIQAYSRGKNTGATFIVSLNLWSRKEKHSTGLIYG